MILSFPRLNTVEAPARVVVTGGGVITAHGAGWQKNAEAFREGRVGFREVSLFDVSRQRCRIGAQVELPAELPAGLSCRVWDETDRALKFLLVAGLEAWQQCGWEDDEFYPMVLGTTSGGMTLGQEFYQASAAGVPLRPHAWRVIHYQPQVQGRVFADALGIQTQPTIIANACASGANAIGWGWQLIRSGRHERVISGGYDALCQLVYAGFDSLQALSPTPCRPFDNGREGLSLGEGAAVLMLESLESAVRRKARIWGEIAGYSAVTDVHHLTQPKPDGEAALRAMSRACEIAGVSAADVQYVNAHGTGTPLNDRAEALAISNWSGDHSRNLWVSSTKAGVGHTLGAAGAIEAAVCLMGLQDQFLPPQQPVTNLDPGCRFRIVTRPTSAQLELAVSNSFGFGGANAALVFRRWA